MYIAVYSFGGIISRVETGTDLDFMISEMKQRCKDCGFDYECDYARIFKEGEPEYEVHSYDHTEN